jgi:hypothetical protein
VKLLSALFLAGLTASAGPITIDSYNIFDAALAGYGLWGHNYTGTITPGASFSGGFAGTYTGGSGTLNNGIIESSVDFTQLFNVSELNPVLTLFLPGTYSISSITIRGGNLFENMIPGCLTGVTVGIGAGSEALGTTAMGATAAPGGCGLVDDRITITGTSLQNLVGNSIQLSNFLGAFDGAYFSIAEIEIDGTAVSSVPEPAAMGLIGLGLMGIACFKRRA